MYTRRGYAHTLPNGIGSAKDTDECFDQGTGPNSNSKPRSNDNERFIVELTTIESRKIFVWYDFWKDSVFRWWGILWGVINIAYTRCTNLSTHPVRYFLRLGVTYTMQWFFLPGLRKFGSPWAMG